MPRYRLKPLKNIPVTTAAGDVEIRGVIEALWPNDMIVVIASPVDGLKTDLHVPHFAMCRSNWLATFSDGRTIALTVRGRMRAESLLRELYDASRGRGSGWDVYAVDERRSREGDR